MKRRKIRSLSVSEIGMGCMGFSHGYGQVPGAGYAEEAIREAFGYGCNFFDTAEGYGKELYYPGHNEEIVGRAVRGFRNEVVIATKLHIRPEAVEDCGSVYAAVRRHLERSLKNLQIDYVDLYYLHRINMEVDNLEVAHAMGRLIQEGLVREWGISTVDKAQLEAVPIVEMLRSFAAEKQATPAQVSLAWMLRKYTNVVPIPGSKNKERIMENLRACEMQLTDEEFDRLDSELDRLPVYGIRGHAETEQTSFGNNWLKLK